jgi:hypothetical protein
MGVVLFCKNFRFKVNYNNPAEVITSRALKTLYVCLRSGF